MKSNEKNEERTDTKLPKMIQFRMCFCSRCMHTTQRYMPKLPAKPEQRLYPLALGNPFYCVAGRTYVIYGSMKCFYFGLISEPRSAQQTSITAQ